jgi:hypothetical protein
MAETIWVTGTWQGGRAHSHTLLRHRCPGETIVARQRQDGLAEGDPLASDIPAGDCTFWRGFASAPEAGGWVGGRHSHRACWFAHLKETLHRRRWR